MKVQDFFEGYFKKTPEIWFLYNEFYADLSDSLKNKIIYASLNPLKKKFSIFFQDKEHDYKATKPFVRDVLSCLYLQTY